MLCRNPFIDRAGRPFPCGKCVPCLYKRKRVWAHRIVLESFCHASSVFVTLTYNDQHLPSDGCLVPDHLQLWLKRIRRELAPHRVRFFACGEYGGETWRPHYHLALFGMPGCANGSTNYNIRGEVECCQSCSCVSETWGLGRVQLAPLTGQSASYIAGYVTKKLGESSRPSGLVPEFQRMSLRPGLGADAMDAVSSALIQFSLEKTEIDVPSHLRHGKFLMPLGRYLKQKLRLKVGLDEKTPEAVLKAVEAELLPLRLAARSSSENPSFKKHLMFAGNQAALNLEARLARQRKVK